MGALLMRWLFWFSCFYASPKKRSSLHYRWIGDLLAIIEISPAKRPLFFGFLFSQKVEAGEDFLLQN